MGEKEVSEDEEEEVEEERLVEGVEVGARDETTDSVVIGLLVLLMSSGRLSGSDAQ